MEDKNLKEERRTSPVEVVVVIVLILALAVMVKPFIGKYKSMGPFGYDNPSYGLLNLAHYIFRFLILIGFVKLFSEMSLKGILSSFGFKKPLLRPALVVLIAGGPIFIFSLYIFSARDVMNPIGTELATIAFLVVGQGLIEESFWRGYVFNRFIKGNRWASASFFTSLLYGLVALTNLFLGDTIYPISTSFVYRFLLSYFLCYLFFRSERNIWGVVLFQVLLNFRIVISGAGIAALSGRESSILFFITWLSVIWGYFFIGALLGKAPKPEEDKDRIVIK